MNCFYRILQRLENRVKSGATPAIDYSFADVQGLAVHSPLVITRAWRW